MFEIITLDADDTLWHTDLIFVKTRHEFTRILSKYHNVEWIESNFSRTEIKNLSRYGYGIKGFALSMIETAIELTEGRVSGYEMKKVLNLVENMQATPLELLDGVRETVLQLSRSYKLMILTKGDLFDQEVKIAQSGLGSYITAVFS